MKKLILIFTLLLSFQSLACEEQVNGWKADPSANPWQMDTSKTTTEGYWVYKNPYRCGTIDSPKQWTFVELKGSKLESEIQNIKGFAAKQAKLVKLGAKPLKHAADRTCWRGSELSVKAESHYHLFKNELQYKVKFMIDNGHLTMEDYKVLPECPY